jgi:hypothetical protein
MKCRATIRKAVRCATIAEVKEADRSTDNRVSKAGGRRPKRISPRGATRGAVDALGPRALLGQGSSDRQQDDQRTVRDPGGKASFQRSSLVAPLSGACGRLLRVAQRGQDQAADADSCQRPRALWLRRPLGDTWKKPDGTLLESFTIATCAPNDLMRGIHDRMPVIIQRMDETAWLDPRLKSDRVMPLLAPYPTEMMEAYPVSTLVNSPANDSAACAEPDIGSLF